MSRLYASIDADASKTQATRRGHKYLVTHTRGWDSGVEVRAHALDDGRVVFEVFRTGGSNAATSPQHIATVIGETIEQHRAAVQREQLLREAL